MIKLGFTKNDFYQLGMALLGMLALVWTANEAGLTQHLLENISRPVWMDAKATITIVFATIGILLKKFILDNKNVPTTD